MKKRSLFLIILIIIALFAFVPTAAIADETAQNRAGPILIIAANVQDPGIAKIVITKALVVAPDSGPLGVWAQTSNTKSNLSLTELKVITLIELPVVTIVSTDTRPVDEITISRSYS